MAWLLRTVLVPTHVASPPPARRVHQPLLICLYAAILRDAVPLPRHPDGLRLRCAAWLAGSSIGVGS